MNQLFERMTVRIGNRRVSVRDVRGFVTDGDGSRVLLNTNEQLVVNEKERDILQKAITRVASQIASAKLGRTP